MAKGNLEVIVKMAAIEKRWELILKTLAEILMKEYKIPESILFEAVRKTMQRIGELDPEAVKEH